MHSTYDYKLNSVYFIEKEKSTTEWNVKKKRLSPLNKTDKTRLEMRRRWFNAAFSCKWEKFRSENADEFHALFECEWALIVNIQMRLRSNWVLFNTRSENDTHRDREKASMFLWVIDAYWISVSVCLDGVSWRSQWSSCSFL